MIALPLTPLEQHIVQRIAQHAARQPAALRLWVFGSRARGDSDEASDLDLAIEFDAAESPALRTWIDEVRRDVEEPLLGYRPGLVDLLGLFAGDADPRLATQVRADGQPVWQRAAAVMS